MKEKYTPYLKKQFSNPSIAAQYLVKDSDPVDGFNDPLHEDSNEPVKGLIHKYHNRALIKVSYKCAAHCRFCTRIRQIGTGGEIYSVKHIVDYLKSHTEITDVILSGGDPFYTPKQTLLLLDEIDKIKSVKVVRIGTRLPIHNPVSFKSQLIVDVLDRVSEMNKHMVILVHIEHPDELTNETIWALRRLRQTGATILSQSVFLKGINNNLETLAKLFESLYWNGVIPYYIYRCDYVKGLEQYVCDIDQEIDIMTGLRSRLSGIACPTYIVDVEGIGKIPVPLKFWDADVTQCRDFSGNKIIL